MTLCKVCVFVYSKSNMATTARQSYNIGSYVKINWHLSQKLETWLKWNCSRKIYIDSSVQSYAFLVDLKSRMKKSCIFMKSMLQLEPTSCIDLTKLELMEIFVFIPPLPGGGYTVLPLSVWPSVQDIFRRIFLSNCWWQKSDIWSQASYRYTILWVAFLDPLDSYFLFADLVGLYTHWTYMHIFRHIFLSNYWWQKSDMWSQASYRYPISWEAFLNPSDSYFLFADLVGFYTHWTYMHIFRHIFHSNYWWQKSDMWSQASYRYPISWEAFLNPLLPVCRLCWFLYTLNIYAHFSSHFSQQLLMAEIGYLVTSFI